ncbi:MAG: type I DNA topoisomerase [Candidatus Limnocylindrales bacterium]
MNENLVIVESPAKAKTIERYLGPGYRVLASYGHVRDLPEKLGKDQLGVDVEHDFAPTYEVVADRRKQVSEISKAARTADMVFLATDLDREGEAIAWHVAQAARLKPERTQRVTFNEITESAIREAFAHPRQIDLDLVDAQQARRIVDRLFGYTLSPLLWRRIRRGLSAGRVQSVAVRLVVDRENEIRAFSPVEYWTIEATLHAPDGAPFGAELVRIDGAKPVIGDEATALAHTEALRASRPIVRSIAVKTSRRSPAPPFTTSTLQQEASRKLGFGPKRTMSVAQRLYEGLETDDGQVGLITYMRTDSVALAGQAMGEAREVIAARFGQAYTMPKGRPFKTKTRNAQEAHEAIRPTSFERSPDQMEKVLPRDEARLYRLIWQRALASQMKEKELETTSVDLEADRYGLRASATRTVFDGFSAVYTEGQDDAAEELERSLPALREGDQATVESIEPTQHHTEPPPRFTEATLIKALEEHGIGRPSTYAATISTILDRGYVSVQERRLRPEPVGEIVNNFLVEHFGALLDPEFTARMEEDLDEVAGGKRNWVPLVRAFYLPLGDAVAAAGTDGPGAGMPTDEVCSLGHPMVMRAGRYGEYLACANYPEHKETRPIGPPAGSAGPNGEPPPDLPGVGEACPECGAEHGGKLVAKRGRFGPFVGCDRYQDCKYIKKDGPPPPEQLPFKVICPECGKGHLTARRARRTGTVFWGCSSYPKCGFTTSREPVGAIHEADAGPVAKNVAKVPDAGEAPGANPSAGDAGPGDAGGAPAPADERTGVCLACGASIPLPAGDLVGRRLAGGPADPTALRRPGRGGRPAGRGRPTSSRSSRSGGRTTRAPRTRGSAATESAKGA